MLLRDVSVGDTCDIENHGVLILMHGEKMDLVLFTSGLIWTYANDVKVTPLPRRIFWERSDRMMEHARTESLDYEQHREAVKRDVLMGYGVPADLLQDAERCDE